MDTNQNLKQYIELRTILDSVEIGALRYYLNASDPTVQEANFKYLKAQMKPILDHIWGRKSPREDDCPEGYHDCSGCCVPYTCIGGNLPKPKA